MSNITNEGEQMLNKKPQATGNILDIIAELIKNNPNDSDLGEQIRLLYKEIRKNIK